MSQVSKSKLYLILFVCAFYSSSLVNCDQPVFVLETSDSSSESAAAAAAAAAASFQSNEQPSSSVLASKRDTGSIQTAHSHNTQIITDDNASSADNVENNKSSSTSHSPVVTHSVQHPSETNHKQHSAGANGEHKIPAPTSSSTTPQQQQQQQQHTATKPSVDQQQQNNNYKETPTVRRLDESPAPSQKSTHTRSAAQTRNKVSTTTTSSPYYDQQSAPKTEERLLISITSEEDEYKPPQRQVIASTGGFDEVQPTPTSSSYQQQQQLLPHKKKPAITISIQDNSNKQGGSGGTPSVILRPSENGQSIIISTLGSSAIEPNNNNNNKYNQNKPAIAIVSSSSGASNNNNNEHPYREPVVDIPVQHHNNPASTHRPTNMNNNEYNPPVNKPIVSTLIDQPRPPVNVMPTQRPPIVSLNEDYEPQPQQQQRPSTHRPPTDYNSNSNNNNNNNNNYNENAGSGLVGGSDIIAPSNNNNNNNNNNGGSKYPLNEKNCGVIHETRIVGGDEANPNDFLWMAAVIKSRPTDGEVKPFCGGSLITRRHILTAAHCLDGLAPRDVLVRLGSYDFDDATASPLSNDYAIDQFRKPAQYNKKTHVADIAIMRLRTPLQVSDNYKTVCMPQARRSYVGALGTVTGYGSQSQTFRRAAPKLRQVTVPIWENRKCSSVYKRNLTESFLCAGYDEGGKDACQGDSGGPLMTEGPNERTIVVGVVSHGIGCGSPGYPGVYTRISTFLDWIEENTRE